MYFILNSSFRLTTENCDCPYTVILEETRSFLPHLEGRVLRFIAQLRHHIEGFLLSNDTKNVMLAEKQLIRKKIELNKNTEKYISFLKIQLFYVLFCLLIMSTENRFTNTGIKTQNSPLIFSITVQFLRSVDRASRYNPCK
jgi:hypothetical protein